MLLTGKLELRRQTKVSDFNVHAGGEQEVGQGQVPVYDPMSVEIQHSLHDLMHEVPRC